MGIVPMVCGVDFDGTSLGGEGDGVRDGRGGWPGGWPPWSGLRAWPPWAAGGAAPLWLRGHWHSRGRLWMVLAAVGRRVCVCVCVCAPAPRVRNGLRPRARGAWCPECWVCGGAAGAFVFSGLCGGAQNNNTTQNTCFLWSARKPSKRQLQNFGCRSKPSKGQLQNSGQKPENPITSRPSP